MKIKPYLDKLEKSSEFKNFKVKYPEAYLVAGFFVLDLESGQNIHQIDYYIPKEKKIAAFTLDGGVQLQILDLISKDNKVPEKLNMKTKIDLDAIEGILSDEMHNRGISDEIKKIIAVVQNIDGKKIWNLNCVLTGMEILRSHIEDESKTILKIEKTSFVDIMKKAPMQQLQPQAQEPKTQEEISQTIAKIGEIESALEKQKAELTK